MMILSTEPSCRGWYIIQQGTGDVLADGFAEWEDANLYADRYVDSFCPVFIRYAS